MMLSNENVMGNPIVTPVKKTAAGHVWKGRIALALRKFLTALMRTLSAPAA
jgi:hypothetical protein